MSPEVDFAVSIVRPDSPQLFLLFPGNADVMTIDPLEFIRTTGIGSRNIVIFRDPFRSFFHEGFSGEYRGMDGIVRWQKERLADRFPHVREVFCVGTSSGCGATIHSAYQLKARAAWSFGGRYPRPGALQESDRYRSELFLKTIGRESPVTMTPEELRLITRAVGQPEAQEKVMQLTENPDTILDWDWLRRMAGEIRGTPGGTDFHFYYARTNDVDRCFAEGFQGCPGVALHPVIPPWGDRPPRPGSFNKPDHLIVPILKQTGELPSVFASYL